MSEMFNKSNDVSLSYKVEGDGTPVLLLHGVGSSQESWDGVISHLQSSRRYMRFDMRGHGNSSRTPGPYSLAELTQDVVDFLDFLEVEKVELVGFSLGGLIAQSVALTHAERLTSLTLISTVAGRTSQEQNRVDERAAVLENEGPLVLLAKSVDRWFTDEFCKAHPEVLEARRQISLQNDPDCYVAAYRVLAGNDLGSELHNIKVPTLVMTGENDIGSSARMAKFIHAQIEHSKLHILPRLKHSVLLEAPDQVAALIDPFLLKQKDSP